MPGAEVVLRARRIITPSGEVAGTLVVSGGRIAALEAFDSTTTGREVVVLDDDTVLMPGLVDTHVHLNEPGRTEWEGFSSGTRAAAAGGVTTLVDMPLNCIPPTTDVDALRTKQQAARDQVHVDVGFWGGAVPGNLGSLRALHEAGVLGFKCFLVPSGVDEFEHLEPAELLPAMREVAAFHGLMVVHAEDPQVIDAAEPPAGRSYQGFLASRPRRAEDVAVQRVIDAARETGCRVHVLHVSSAGVLPLVAAARAAGVPVSAETCPHYLTLAADDVPDGGTQFKCCPPIREGANAEELWRGLRDGVVDCVVSDHSPSTPDLKALGTGDFAAAWGGIASLQVGLPVVWTAARARGLTLVDVARWMASEPARIAGLRGKGRIEVGAVADLGVFAPDEHMVVDPAELHHRSPVTPYAGRAVTGVVRSTWLAGRRVDIDGEPRGRLLDRETS